MKFEPGISEDQYAVLSDMAGDLRKAVAKNYIRTVNRFFGYDCLKEPKTEEEWSIYLECQERATQLRHEATEKRRREHAMMWLEVYSPGVAYDPSKHWIALPEEEVN